MNIARYFVEKCRVNPFFDGTLRGDGQTQPTALHIATEQRRIRVVHYLMKLYPY